MIQEDYVSFETAKLLKEKWFKSNDCHTAYDENGQFFWYGDYSNDRKGVVDAPTLQMAMKWLREVHGIHINVFRYPAAYSGDNNEKCKPWWFQYTLLKSINEIDIDSRMTDDEFESAEEAMNYAIKYCLENLI